METDTGILYGPCDSILNLLHIIPIVLNRNRGNTMKKISASLLLAGVLAVAGLGAVAATTTAADSSQGSSVAIGYWPSSTTTVY